MVVVSLNFGTYCVTNHKVQTDPLLAKLLSGLNSQRNLGRKGRGQGI